MQLGGKNPTIVDSSANFNIAARRILWGRFNNCGQVSEFLSLLTMPKLTLVLLKTCIAPEYILVVENARDRLIAACNEA